ncbi:MAG: poly-gamma-glutamate system protein [Candidatus Aminicenantes bacterium]|nr:poly-gamma-glutamate system protein [Candidatus Aminicenantes bacterium]
MKRPFGRGLFGPVTAAAALSFAYLLLVRFLPFPEPDVRAEMNKASRTMAAATAAIRACRVEEGAPVDRETDPNGTGLIGLETSPITTSAGRLEAKRTTTNPNFAALVVSLFHEAGVRRGDAVAVGASSSFPALIVATLSAAEVMGLEPVVISSLGASEWGANIPGFNWTDMEDCLRAAGVLAISPLARAIGGDEDVGRDMSPEGRALLESRIRESGVPFLEESDLERNVELRMKLYREGAGTRPIKAFVNIGGSWANIGTNSEVLKLRPGLASGVFVPPPTERGVLQAMAAEKIPVIHLLNIKGLCERYGLPWDPRPLPRPGEGPLFRDAAGKNWPSVALTAVYVLAMIVIMFLTRRRFSE